MNNDLDNKKDELDEYIDSRITFHTDIMYASIAILLILAATTLGNFFPGNKASGALQTIIILIYEIPTLLLVHSARNKTFLRDKPKRKWFKLLAALVFPLGLISTLGIAIDTDVSLITKIILGGITAGLGSINTLRSLDLARNRAPKLQASKALFFSKAQDVIEENTGKASAEEAIMAEPESRFDRITQIISDLNEFAYHCPDLKPLIEQAKSDIDEIDKIGVSIEKVKKKAYKKTMLAELEKVYEEVKEGILVNCDDIITICAAGRADFNNMLSSEEVDDIKMELSDNQYKLNLMKRLLSTMGRSATQKTTDDTNLGLNASVAAIESFIEMTDNSPTLGTR